MNSPFASLNRAQLRTEAADRRLGLRHLTAALCLGLAAAMLAHMVLTTLLAWPDLAAQALAARSM